MPPIHGLPGGPKAASLQQRSAAGNAARQLPVRPAKVAVAAALAQAAAMTSLILAALLASSACAAPQESVGNIGCQPTRVDWRTIATEDDRRRLREWRDAWQAALDQARAGHGAEIAAAGALFEPDAALARPLPPA